MCQDFAFINQILKADFTAPKSLLMLGAYNILYALPFTVVPILAAAIGKESRPILAKINKLSEKIREYDPQTSFLESTITLEGVVLGDPLIL